MSFEGRMVAIVQASAKSIPNRITVSAFLAIEFDLIAQLLRLEPWEGEKMVPIAILAVLRLGRGSVTFTNQAQRLEYMLPALGKAMGVSLKAEGPMRDEIVCVRFKDQPQETVLAKLATALDASWKTTSDGFRLVRGQDEAKQRANRQYENLSKALGKLQADFVKTVSARTVPDPVELEKLFRRLDELSKKGEKISDAEETQQEQLFEKFRRLDPSAVALNRIMSTIDARALATLTPGVLYNFATSPTPMQKVMPTFTKPIFADWRADLKTWYAVVKKFSKTQPPEAQDDFMKHDPANIARIKLVINLEKDGSDVTFSLQALGKDGRREIMESWSFKGESDSMAVATKWMIRPTRQAAIQPTEEAVAIDARLRGRGPQRRMPLPPELQAKLLDTGRNDLLGIICSPPMVQFAEQKNLNLIYIPSDLQLSSGVNVSKGQTELQLREQVGHFCEMIEEGSFLTVRPTLPNIDSSFRMPRPEYAVFIRTWLANGPISLEDVAYFSGYIDHEGSSLPLYLSLLLAGDAISDGDEAEGIWSKVFWGLSADQRQAMTQTGIRFDSLNPELQKLLHHLVFDLHPGFQSDKPTSMIPDNDEDLTDPSDYLPNGIPPGAILRATDEKSIRVVLNRTPAQTTLSTRPMGLGAEQVGNLLFRDGDTKTRPSGFRYNFDKVKMLEHREVEFKLFVLAKEFISSTIGFSDSRGGRLVNWSELPDEFRKAVETTVEEMKSNRDQAGPPKVPPPAKR